MGCGLRVAGSRFLLFTIRPSLLAIRYPLPCRFADFTICRQVFGRANFLVSPIWVRGAECGCQAKIFGNAGALPHKTTRYSLFAIRYSPVAAIFGFNWRVVSCTTKNWTNSAAQESSPPVSFPQDRNFSARQKPCPPEKPLATCYSPFTIRYRFGFNWRVVLQHDRNFFGTAEPCPPEKPFATRYSLLAAVSARQEPRLPNSFRPSSPVPRPVLSWWLW